MDGSTRPPAIELSDALDAFVDVIAHVDAADWARQSMCAEWSVAEVVLHTISITDKFSAFARGETDAPRGRDLRGIAVDDISAQLARAVRESHDAWSAVDLARYCALPFGRFSTVDAEAINIMDLLVHGWDIAHALGRDYRMPAAPTTRAVAMAQRLVTPESVTDGQFASRIGPRADKRGQELLLWLTGRTPVTANPTGPR
ncbi:TIGR03086 family metal-binding protein [Gordonia sp. CPCC 205515]